MPVTVVVGMRFGDKVFGGETEVERVGQRAGLLKRVSESVVEILRRERSALADVGGDVAVVVITRQVVNTVDADGDQPAHPPSALFGAGEVGTPEILDGLTRIVGSVDLFDREQPAVLNEGAGFMRRPCAGQVGLDGELREAVAPVVAAEDALGAGGRIHGRGGN